MEQLLLQLNTAAPNDEIRLIAKKISNEWYLSQRKIFPIGIPDIDREILELVDDQTLIRACSVNHYLRELHHESFWEMRSKNKYFSYLDNYLLPGETYKSLYPLIVASIIKKKLDHNDSNADLKLIKEIICKGYTPLINNLSNISNPVSALILAAKNNKGEISGNIFLRYSSSIVTQERCYNRRILAFETLVNKEVITAFVHNMSPEELTLFIKDSLANIYIREREKFIKCLFIAFINDANIEAMKTILPYIPSNKVNSCISKSQYLINSIYYYDDEDTTKKERDFILEIFFLTGKEMFFSFGARIYSPVLINDLLLYKLPLSSQTITREIIDYCKMVVEKMMTLSLESIKPIVFTFLYPLREHLMTLIIEIINSNNVDHLLVEELIKHKFVHKEDIK